MRERERESSEVKFVSIGLWPVTKGFSVRDEY